MEEIYSLNFKEKSVGNFSSYSLAEEALGIFVEENVEFFYQHLKRNLWHDEVAKAIPTFEQVLENKTNFATLGNCLTTLSRLAEPKFILRYRNSELGKSTPHFPEKIRMFIRRMYTMNFTPFKKDGELGPIQISISRIQLNEKINLL